MKIKLISSLEKVLPDTEPYSPELTEFTIFKNEPFSFQLAVFIEEGESRAHTLSIQSQLKNDLRLFEVMERPTTLNRYENADSFYLEDRASYPDLLFELKDKKYLWFEEMGKWSSLWFKYTPSKEVCGKRKIKITITNGTNVEEKSIILRILDADLPKQELLYTNWFHIDCLCTHYEISPPFYGEFWDVFDAYVKNAVEHGMNMILTPIFTPPIDTEIGGERPTIQLVGVTERFGEYTFEFELFEKFVEHCLALGIEAFEISHLFTQWGACAAPKIKATKNLSYVTRFGWDTDPFGEDYITFLAAFARAFKEEAKKLGIENRIFMHVSDEPSMKDIENYRNASKLLHALFPSYRFIDALSDIEFYKQGLCETPIPCENNADEFFPVVKSFWTYYCCGQSNEFLPNRFFSMPSLRNRILGFLLYKYNAEGFLQWGHNFWYTQYSKKAVNPLFETDAGGAFPSGDAFVVYPGFDKEPMNSLRHEVFYEGICDLRALRLLEKLSSREHALSVLEERLKEPLTFRTYPHDDGWLLGTRLRINEEIKRILKENKKQN